MAACCYLLTSVASKDERGFGGLWRRVATSLHPLHPRMGGFGGLIVLAGQRLLGVQTGLWLLFGLGYLAIGLVFLTGGGSGLRRRIRIAPEAWKSAQSPALQGAAFGLNIPACAAPILFGLLGAATTTGTATAGFAMMAVFALALSAPLLPLSLVPALWESVGFAAFRGLQDARTPLKISMASNLVDFAAAWPAALSPSLLLSLPLPPSLLSLPSSRLQASKERKTLTPPHSSSLASLTPPHKRLYS